jgi:hypothetical protein
LIKLRSEIWAMNSETPLSRLEERVDRELCKQIRLLRCKVLYLMRSGLLRQQRNFRIQVTRRLRAVLETNPPAAFWTSSRRWDQKIRKIEIDKIRIMEFRIDR